MKRKGSISSFIADDTPFQSSALRRAKKARAIRKKLQTRNKKRGEKTMIIADDVYPYEKGENEADSA